jgi:hypothetical protein
MRRQGEHWQLVGEAYVCKIMNVSSLVYAHEMLRALAVAGGNSFEGSGNRGKLQSFIRDSDII